MLPRARVESDPILRGSTIITIPQSTVFRLTRLQARRLEKLWGQAGISQSEEERPSAWEGQVQLSSHRKRERSRFLIAKKLEAARKEGGFLGCEICGITENAPYPARLASRVFEVHHMSPLSLAVTPCKTTLADLAIVFGNCHRAIHATLDVQANMEALRRCFAK